MLKLRFKFLLFLLLVGLLGTGVYLQYLADPDKPPVPESLQGPLERLKGLLGDQGSSLKSDIDRFAAELETYLRAYDEAAPEGYKRLMGHLETESSSTEAGTEGGGAGYSTPSEVLPKVQEEFERMMETIDFSQAPELKAKAESLYQRVRSSIEENAGELRDAAVGTPSVE